MNNERNMIDLGYMHQWTSGGIEYRLLDMVEAANYKFRIVARIGRDVVYECREAGLKLHVDSSKTKEVCL